MKRRFFLGGFSLVTILLIIAIIGMLALLGFKIYTENTGILEYEIIDKQDISNQGITRMAYKIILNVDGYPSDTEMKKTAINIWKQGNRGWEEFTVFMYLPQMDAYSEAYGIAEFNPKKLLVFRKDKLVEEILQKTEALEKQNIMAINSTVKANCGTIQTLIQIELVDSEYESVKKYVFDNSENGLFSKSEIKNPVTGFYQTKYGLPWEKGNVVVVFDDDTEIFFIDGYDYYGNKILEKPLTARR